jgi:hypothetical protein
LDTWDYFQQRRQKCEEQCLDPVGGWDEVFSEEEGSGGRRGIMLGTFAMRDGAHLKIYERVAVTAHQGDDIHRINYAYFLSADGQEIWGRERDPTHDPAEHGHGYGHEHVEAGRVTLQDAIKEAWEVLGEWDKQKKP